ncbi:hypothetical protein VRC03_05860 [Erwinia aphidicola]|uniref:hypothetical protein n=1 Tax=Erwinia aphidicola TaxID=68334 RepID=UPI0030CB9B4F
MAPLALLRSELTAGMAVQQASLPLVQRVEQAVMAEPVAMQAMAARVAMPVAVHPAAMAVMVATAATVAAVRQAATELTALQVLAGVTGVTALQEGMENSASAEVILALIISSSAVVAARLVPPLRGLPVARVLMVVCKEQGAERLKRCQRGRWY